MLADMPSASSIFLQKLDTIKHKSTLVALNLTRV